MDENTGKSIGGASEESNGNSKDGHESPFPLQNMELNSDFLPSNLRYLVADTQLVSRVIGLREIYEEAQIESDSPLFSATSFAELGLYIFYL
jgi:hypothetical protein